MTYSEVARSPAGSPWKEETKTVAFPIKKDGLKIQVTPDRGQLTLEAAISAGKLLDEAKKLKQKVLAEKEVIEVNENLFKLNSSLSFG